MTDAASHVRTTQSGRFPPAAIALAVVLHVMLVAALWWLSTSKPPLMPEPAIDVTLEDGGDTNRHEARPSAPPQEAPLPQQERAADAPPPSPASPAAAPDTPAHETQSQQASLADKQEQPAAPPPATKPATEEASKPPPPPPPPAPSTELKDELPEPDYVPPPTANDFPKPAPPPAQAAKPQLPQRSPPPPPSPQPQAKPAAQPNESRTAALQPSPLSAPGAVMYGAAASGRISYLTLIARQTSQFRYYPRAALQNRESGRVVVRITVARDGRVVDARVSRSSGSQAIDAAEVQTVLKSSPFPPLPPEIPGERATFEVPVNYDLPN